MINMKDKKKENNKNNKDIEIDAENIDADIDFESESEADVTEDVTYDDETADETAQDKELAADGDDSEEDSNEELLDDEDDPDEELPDDEDDSDEELPDDEVDSDIDQENQDTKIEESPRKKVRLYEDYVIDDLEEMDEAPDTGDMFDDDELETYSDQRRKKATRHNVYGPKGKTLAVLWAIFVVMLCGYVYVFHINTTIFADDTTGRDNSVNVEVPAGANYSLCNIDEINQLIGNYLLARTNADQATLQRLVTDPSEFDDMNSVKIAAEYITAYNRTTCYMVPGPSADSYIIYALSNLTIKDVDSEPLDIRSFYVVKQADESSTKKSDTASGLSYKIKNSQLTEAESSYINDVTASKYIQALYQHVKENTDYLLKHDDTFKKFQNLYN